MVRKPDGGLKFIHGSPGVKNVDRKQTPPPAKKPRKKK